MCLPSILTGYAQDLWDFALKDQKMTVISQLFAQIWGSLILVKTKHNIALEILNNYS